jgi:serine/threonine-protein kinase
MRDVGGSLGEGRGLRSGTDRFVIIRQLGRGSSGVVYLGRDRVTGEAVAIKALQVERSASPDLQRFHREIRMLDRLVQPNIVRFIDVVDTTDNICLVMEYVDGEDLRAILQRPRLQPADALTVISALSAGLSYAHSRGILHRDVSAANVLVSTCGDVKLADFGIAKIIAGTISPSLVSFRTATGALLGTPAYISPEATEPGVELLTPSADLYSLAVLSYQLLVGVLPFPVGPDLLITILAHRSESPPRPTSRAPTFPPDIEEVLLRALAKRPTERQPTVAVFWSELCAAASASWPGWERNSDLATVVGTTGDRPTSISSPSVGADTVTVTPTPRPSARIEPRAFVPRNRVRPPGVVTSLALGVLTAVLVMAVLLVVHL